MLPFQEFSFYALPPILFNKLTHILANNLFGDLFSSWRLENGTLLFQFCLLSTVHPSSELWGKRGAYDWQGTRGTFACQLSLRIMGGCWWQKIVNSFRWVPSSKSGGTFLPEIHTQEMLSWQRIAHGPDWKSFHLQHLEEKKKKKPQQLSSRRIVRENSMSQLKGHGRGLFLQHEGTKNNCASSFYLVHSYWPQWEP